MIYGATGATDFGAIAAAIGETVGLDDPLLLVGIALAATGLAFKGSVAPFHQWSPDVYQGAPTPITAFMATATKAAAFAVILRLFDHALAIEQINWGPALAALAAVTIVIGNVGALAQRSLKRLLAWSGVAQAGYLLAGVVVGTQLGLKATFFYLAAYLFMNVAAFAVVIARERVSETGDDLKSFEGLGQASPLLAWPMTIAMLALAGIPATAGFIGKFYLIDAAVDGDYAWLGVMIVVGSMISLAYYLRVIAVMWMGGVEVELPTGRKVRPGRRLVARGGRPRPARGHRRGDPVRGRDDLLRHHPVAAVRPGAGRRHVVLASRLELRRAGTRSARCGELRHRPRRARPWRRSAMSRSSGGTRARVVRRTRRSRRGP